MASVTRHTAVLLLLSIVAAHLGAAACEIDCDRQASSPVSQAASCHEAAGTDNALVQLGPLRAGCHQDHAILTAELAPVLEVGARYSGVALDVVVASWSSNAPLTSATVVQTSPHIRPPAPTGATLPLRL